MAFLRKVINELDPAPDKTKELTLALNLISELAENKVDEFRWEINENYRTAGTPENRTAPITLIIAEHAEYRSYVSDDASKLSVEVMEAIKKFVSNTSEDIISGIGNLITAGLEALLGSGEGSQQEMRSYYITAQSRALVRYDIYAWRRKIEAKGITSKMESCMAIYASKASVDVASLDLNAFLLAYQDQLARMNFSDEQVTEYLDEAEEIYRRLRGDSAISSAEAASQARTALIGRAQIRAIPQLFAGCPVISSPPPRPSMRLSKRVSN